MAERLVERVWRGSGPVTFAVRALLSPLGALYLALAAVRNRLFESGILRVTKPAMPVLSVGNLTAGGTGKTPVSAWLAAELKTRGALPAIVMRGFGADEVIVHRILSPDTPVIVSPSRAAGIEEARARGCDLAVLDDAFQHRWVARQADIALLSAEETVGARRGLPAGPWRERLQSIRRATLAIVTRKSASPERRDAVLALIRSVAPDVPTAAVRLVPDMMVRCGAELGAAGAERRSLREIEHRSVFVVAAVGNARAFVEQISKLGGRMSEALYPDHHPFSQGDADALAARAAQADFVLCTLKDAVKLAPLWPKHAQPLWYVSQQVIIERGADAIDAQLDALLKARRTANDTAGASRPLP